MLPLVRSMVGDTGSHLLLLDSRGFEAWYILLGSYIVDT